MEGVGGGDGGCMVWVEEMEGVGGDGGCGWRRWRVYGMIHSHAIIVHRTPSMYIRLNCIYGYNTPNI